METITQTLLSEESSGIWELGQRWKDDDKSAVDRNALKRGCYVTYPGTAQANRRTACEIHTRKRVDLIKTVSRFICKISLVKKRKRHNLIFWLVLLLIYLAILLLILQLYI